MLRTGDEDEEYYSDNSDEEADEVLFFMEQIMANLGPRRTLRHKTTGRQALRQTPSGH